MGFGIEIGFREEEGRTVVLLAGRLDAANTPILDRRLRDWIDDGQQDFILDFSKVTYLSSAGIRLLLSMTQNLTKAGGGFSLCSINAEVMEIIEMAGFEQILNIYPTAQEAL